KMDLDPFELRYRNIYREGATTPTGQTPDVYCLEEMYDRARPYYEEAKARVADLNAKSDGRYKYGVGISQGIYGCGLDGADSAAANVQLNPDNTVTILDSWEDHGQGADIGSLSMAHGTLREAGFTPEQIKLIKNDTGLTPNSGPAGGSRSNVMVGNAIVAASRMLVNAMRREDGTYRDYDAMIEENIPVFYEGSWVASAFTNCSLETAQGEPFSVYMYELFIPEVEVNIETGKVRVIRFTTVPDVGTIINRSVVDGQIYGGLAQGIGLALSENMEDYDKHTTLRGCGIPYAEDVPDEMIIDYIETPRPLGPYGAAGCGEAPLTAPHPAILGAIFDATGARITAVPATPDVVKAAIDELA
ncbi:MAG: molybdopterin-dependent oxidoreductase, partial [Clostridiaceae bacterium]|nr:molybdopterin-dependent oxidoreductase [Clostridiaceae bacterium]